MKKIVKYTDLAWDDIYELADHIAKDSYARATLFIEDTMNSIDYLSDFPGLGRIFELSQFKRKQIHFWPVANHKKILIFYTIENNSIQIIRVLHSARDITTILEEE